MFNTNETAIIKEIRTEYNRIDSRWLKLHCRILVGLVVAGFLFECVFGMVLFARGYVEISLDRYILKYILAPACVNTVLTGVATWAMRSSRLRQKGRIYIVSLLYVAICLVLFSVHSIFSTLYPIFFIPILLTVVYSDYRLTTVTAFSGIAAKTISELFIIWDPDREYVFSNEHGIANFCISLFILCVFYLVCMVVIRYMKEKNAASIQKEIEHYQVRQKLKIDDLTEVYNRTALRTAFQLMEEDSADNSYTFAMLDLDNFKILNDTLGHAIGDECLKEFARVLKKNCTEGTVPIRFGGDEFCILFKNKDLNSVAETCQQIQSDLKEINTSQPGIRLTASIGIACYHSSMTPLQLLRNTDAALYRAKEIKDTMCFYDDTSQAVSCGTIHSDK
jgi:diguanylate cyclase (GGDEF)-like protein